MVIKVNSFKPNLGLPVLTTSIALISFLGALDIAAKDLVAIDSTVTKAEVTGQSSDSESDDANDAVNEVIVVGSRRNLMTAQDIKRDADTFVDAISSDDIGALPDRSILDAIQRLPGVAIERFSAPNDPDHFSVEGSGVILRGMTQTRSEFNGRDSFTANSGRGLSFQDVSSELMGGVEVYKNQTADMIEGGIGGSVNLKTRKPFDADERVMSFSADYSYGDLAKEASPTVSGLFSDTWDTSAGRIGFLFNVSKSILYGESHGIQSDAFTQYYAANLAGAEAFTGEDGNGTVWIPNGANLLMKEDERKRDGVSLGLQFESADETMLATFQFMRSDASLIWNERAIKYQGNYFDIESRQSAVLDGTTFEFDEQGLFQSGVIVNQNDKDTWRSGRAATNRVPSYEFKNQWGHAVQMNSRVSDTETLVEDYAFNFEWTPNSKLKVESDFQYIRAETASDDVSISINTWAGFDYNLDGSIPSLTLIEPWFGARDEDALSGGGIYGAGLPGFSGDPLGDSNFFQDPNSYLWTSAMDHYERSNGESLAVRLDATYTFDDNGFFKSLSAGLRHAKREQVVRSSIWNWGETTPIWKSRTKAKEGAPDEYEPGPGWLSDIESQQGDYERVNWSNFMHGNVANIPGGYTFHADEAFMRAVSGTTPSRTILGTGFDGRWVPLPNRKTVVRNKKEYPLELDSKYGLFTPGEMNETIETRNSIYVRLDFSGDGELPFSGNIGLRYLDMQRDAIGDVEFPVLNWRLLSPEVEGLPLPLTSEIVTNYLQGFVDDGTYTSLNHAVERNEYWIYEGINYLPLSDRNFATNNTQDTEAHVNTYKLLPSFNIKLELTGDLVSRFAIAKALAFPNIEDVRNRVIVAPGTISTVANSSADTPIERTFYKSSTINWIGGGGNPFIQPMESVQYDFSLEWYFSEVGQLSASIFHKNLSNVFIQGISPQTFTNEAAGVTKTTNITSTINGGKAKLDGTEISYHQFFDGVLDGFGVQATYTYVNATNVPNDQTDVKDERWYGSRFEDTGIRVNLSSIPLQGQSDHTVNLLGMYEKGQWDALIGYNWRSKYLLTTRDVTSKAPQWYDDHGELNGSIFYDIDERFSIGLQATNITNARSDIIMILNDELLSTGRSWFMSDRRIAFVVKGSF